MFDKLDNKMVMTKMQASVSLILVLFLSVTGATFAYFAISISDNTITGEAATVNLTLNVTKVFPTDSSENTGVMVPQLGTTSPLTSALKVGCVDTISNVICQVYKISIQNFEGTATQVVDGRILFYGNSEMTQDITDAMPNLKWRIISSADATNPSNSVLGSNVTLNASSDEDLAANTFANDITLSTNDLEEYYIIIWINETSGEQTLEPGKSFFGRVDFNSSNGTGVTSTFTS